MSIICRIFGGSDDDGVFNLAWHVWIICQFVHKRIGRWALNMNKSWWSRKMGDGVADGIYVRLHLLEPLLWFRDMPCQCNHNWNITVARLPNRCLTMSQCILIHKNRKTIRKTTNAQWHRRYAHWSSIWPIWLQSHPIRLFPFTSTIIS